ncbi:MAG TPA: Smr/MutS family protein [Syntrophomonadaceae bacterium]|nr:Smr/MutS family protein [Syntrophomonadaceae bacterium]
MMKIEHIDLHGHNLAESVEKLEKNLKWCIRHGVDVLVINHGKGHHSQGGFSVLKSEIRKALKENDELHQTGYRIIYGESDFPIALTFNEGQTLVVMRGREQEYIGGRDEQEKNKQIYSEEGKWERKAHKRKKAQKRSRKR